jgi:hypothetical protein
LATATTGLGATPSFGSTTGACATGAVVCDTQPAARKHNITAEHNFNRLKSDSNRQSFVVNASPRITRQRPIYCRKQLALVIADQRYYAANDHG